MKVFSLLLFFILKYLCKFMFCVVYSSIDVVVLMMRGILFILMCMFKKLVYGFESGSRLCIYICLLCMFIRKKGK
jgi:hypothetical protein